MNELDRFFSDIEKCLIKNFNSLLDTNGNINQLFNFSSLNDFNVEEKDDKVNLYFKIPNLTNEHELNVSVNQNHIILQGNLIKEMKLKSDRGKNVTSSYYEYLYRAVPLPAGVTSEGAKVHYDKGVLKVSLKKTHRLAGL